MDKLVRFDWAMKYLLRNKANFAILEGFLSELLKIDVHIETILESESNKETTNDKQNRVDLLVRTHKKEHVIIEIQCSSEWDYLRRILYGTSKAITEYLSEGNPYKDIHKVISISVVFFNLGEGKDYIYKGTTEFRGIHFQDELKLGSNELKVYGQTETPSTIFPEYYLLKVNQFNERIQSKFDEWMYFLKNGQIKAEFVAKGIQKAAETLDVLRLSEEKRRAYESYRQQLHYQASMALPYDLGMKEGKKEGKVEGIEIGKAKGIEIGKAKGIEIGKAKGIEIGKAEGIEIGVEISEMNTLKKLAVKMYQQNFSIDRITETLDVDKELVKAWCLE